MRRRLDAELVRRGLARSRDEARRLVESGVVLVAGAPADKASRLVAATEAVSVGSPSRYVSRGGEKLAAALERFAVDVSGAFALDAGASTGGFTDCLLQSGAAHVVAVDVGRGQLHPTLRSSARVTVLERTNVRDLTPDLLRSALGGSLGEGVEGERSGEDAGEVGGLGVGEDVGEDVGARFDVVVADLSFISLTVVLPVLLGPLVRPGADAVLLVKPQFEAGRAEASRGRGVIRDEAVRRDALVRVGTAALARGASIMGIMASPVLGPAGNAEYLLHARPGPRCAAAPRAEEPGGSDTTDESVAAMVDAALAESPDRVGP